MHIEHRAAAHHRQVWFSDLTLWYVDIFSSEPPDTAVKEMDSHKLLLEFPLICGLSLILIVQGTAAAPSLAHTDPLHLQR